MNAASTTLTPMTLADYDEAAALWRCTDGVGFSKSDERDGVERYLARNPGMSCVARHGGRLVGTLMAGHDGRRGYLFHLAVASDMRRRGIARALVDRSLAALKAAGIERAHAMVFSNNAVGQDFWRHLGWQHLDVFCIYSMSLTSPGEPITIERISAKRTESNQNR